MTDKQPILLSRDKNIGPTEHAMLTDRDGMIQVTPEMLQDMAKQAKETYDGYYKFFNSIMNPDVAAMIREARVDTKCSWRQVAAGLSVVFTMKTGHSPISPPTNQLAGMAACKAAQEFLKEEGDRDWDGVPEAEQQ